MNKAALCARIIAQLQTDLATQTAAAHLARDEAISEESRPESKYDTHSQEAAYLAEGQARIAKELQAGIVYYQALSPVDLPRGSPIAIGALVELNSRGQTNWYFIGPNAGGTEAILEGKSVLVLTPQSPFGRELMGRRQGDTVSILHRGTVNRHVVVSVQ